MTLWIWNIAAVREIFSEMLARLPANGVIDDYRGVRLTRSLLGWDLHFAFALRVIITFRCGGPARCQPTGSDVEEDILTEYISLASKHSQYLFDVTRCHCQISFVCSVPFSPNTGCAGSS
jgi:hypothetical protein